MSESSSNTQRLRGELPGLQILARHLCGNDDPEDMVQRTVVTALSQDVQPRRLRPWLRQVLRNEVRMRARRESRRRMREQRSVASSVGEHPELTIAQIELAAIVVEEVDRLPETQRELLRERFFKGCSAAEIARTRGCPPSTVRSQTQSALAALRAQLDRRLGERAQWMGGLLPLCVPGRGLGKPAIVKLGAIMNKATIWKTSTAAILVLGGFAAALIHTAQAEHEPDATPGVERSASALAGDASPRRHQPAQRTLESNGETASTVSTAAGQKPSPAPKRDSAGVQLNQSVRTMIEACYRDLGRPPEGAYADLLFQFEADEQGWGLAEVKVRDQGGDVSAELLQCAEESLEAERIPHEQPLPEGERPKMGMLLTLDDGQRQKRLAEQQRENKELMATMETIEPMDAVGKLALEPRGKPDAKVTLLECSDFDCKFCKRTAATLRQVHENYPERVVIHWLNNPLPIHRHAELKARAALAAQNQGKFWEMHDVLIAEDSGRNEEDMRAHAEALGLDVGRFMADLVSEDSARMVVLHQKVCRESGALGTPSVFLNGDMIPGAKKYEEYVEIIEEELAIP